MSADVKDILGGLNVYLRVGCFGLSYVVLSRPALTLTPGTTSRWNTSVVGNRCAQGFTTVTSSPHLPFLNTVTEINFKRRQQVKLVGVDVW